LSSLHHVSTPSRPVQGDGLAWFRFGDLGEKVVLTTDAGDWHTLSPGDFSSLLQGTLSKEGNDYMELLGKGFIRDGYDVEHHASRFRRVKRFIGLGPTRHHLHLSTSAGVLAIDQAKEILDHALASSAEKLTIAMFEGPSPLNGGLVSFIQEFSEEKNQYEKKTLSYELHSKLENMDKSLMDAIVAKKISVRTPFDGSAELHDAQREWTGALPHAEALAQILSIHESARDAGLENHQYAIVADVAVGARALGQAAAIADGLTEAGVRDFRVTPILDGPEAISSEDHAAFYGELIDVLMNRPAGAARLRELNAHVLLMRIESGADPEDLRLSSPTGWGLNTRSYAPDGGIFPSCSALELGAEGDPIFQLGSVADATQEAMANHATVRTFVVASIADCLPGYQHLWSSPYIGVDPVTAYRKTGDLFTRMPTSREHGIVHGMVEVLFKCLVKGDTEGVTVQLAGG
jgi:sulfatase maturation enzyme AslB (radical SAM superfamily)